MTFSIKQRVAQSFSRAAAGYDSIATVQKQSAEQLLAFTEFGAGPSPVVLDVGSGTGSLLRMLPFKAAYSVALDLAPGMLQQARNCDQSARINAMVCADLETLPFAASSFDLIVSNFALQWSNNLAAVFEQFHQVLRPNGSVLLCLPVTETLWELAASWRRAGSTHAHVNQFFNPAQISALLNQAGFQRLQMQTFNSCQFFTSVRELLVELKQVGAHQVMDNGTTGMMSKGRFQAMVAAYESYRGSNGLLPASWHYVVVRAER